MEQDHESSVDGSPFAGAIFMSNRRTKEECFHWKIFGLPPSYSGFVKQIKIGMILFLFEYEERMLYGVFEATSDGAINIVPNAFANLGLSYPAQIHFKKIWSCQPLSEDEFSDAIRENYCTRDKFKFGLTHEQVIKLVHLFALKRADFGKNLNLRTSNKYPTESGIDFHKNLGYRKDDDHYTSGCSGLSPQDRRSSSFHNVSQHKSPSRVPYSPSQKGRVYKENFVTSTAGGPLDTHGSSGKRSSSRRTNDLPLVQDQPSPFRSQSNLPWHNLEFSGLPSSKRCKLEVHSNKERFFRYRAREPLAARSSFVDPRCDPHPQCSDHHYLVEGYDPSSSQLSFFGRPMFSSKYPDSLPPLSGSSKEHIYPPEASQQDDRYGLQCEYNSLMEYIPLSNDLERTELSPYQSTSGLVSGMHMDPARFDNMKKRKGPMDLSSTDSIAMKSETGGVYSDDQRNDNVFNRLSSGPPIARQVNEARVSDVNMSLGQLVDLLSQRRIMWSKVWKGRRLPFHNIGERWKATVTRNEAGTASVGMIEGGEVIRGSEEILFLNFKRRSEIKKTNGEAESNSHVEGGKGANHRRRLVRPVLVDEETICKDNSNSIQMDVSGENSGRCSMDKGQNWEVSQNNCLALDSSAHNERNVNPSSVDMNVEDCSSCLTKSDISSRVQELAVLCGVTGYESSRFNGEVVEIQSSSRRKGKNCEMNASSTECEVMNLKVNSDSNCERGDENSVNSIDDELEKDLASLDPYQQNARARRMMGEDNGEVKYASEMIGELTVKDRCNFDPNSGVSLSEHVDNFCKDSATETNKGHKVQANPDTCLSDTDHDSLLFQNRSQSEKEADMFNPIVDKSVLSAPSNLGSQDPVVLDIGNKPFSFNVEHQPEKSSDDLMIMEVGFD